MKETILKGALALLLAGTAAYFRRLAAPICVLIAVMLADYVSGMMSAWASRTLSSRIGLRGVLKKLGCILAVGVAITVDFVVQTAGARLGADLAGFYAFGLLVTVWLILNECISILENLTELGVPVPAFLRAAVARLKQRAEAAGEKTPPFAKGGWPEGPGGLESESIGDTNDVPPADSDPIPQPPDGDSSLFQREPSAPAEEGDA